MKEWVGSQQEAQLREDVMRELKAVWQEKDALWALISNDPEKGLYLEKSRAQRRQHDRWVSPSKGGGSYGVADDDDDDDDEEGDQQKRNNAWYGSSALALRGGAEGRGRCSISKQRASHLASSSYSRPRVLREARRVAVLLGRVREELVGEEEVEVQRAEGPAVGEAGNRQQLEDLRQKREKRIMENKSKTSAQVRSAITSTAAALGKHHHSHV